jgi:small subunit ribosomal protein S14
MKAPSVRDKAKRSKLVTFEQKKKSLKSLKNNQTLKLTSWARLKLETIPFFEVKNRCIVTGRGKAINRAFKLSRLEFRRWSNIAKLPGLEKSSW